MSSVTADSTNDVCSEISLLRTVVFAVTNLTTVLASLVFIITKSTVECSELTKLVALKLVLTFWNGRSLSLLAFCFAR